MPSSLRFLAFPNAFTGGIQMSAIAFLRLMTIVAKRSLPALALSVD
jgi:hypothetical protein